MTISVGDKLPDATFKERTADGTKEVTTADLFGGKRVVLFAVPGAFTPTCHRDHLPGYLENRETILAKGVDEIAVVAVNDAYVMEAWAEATGGAGKIRFLSDWNADFTRKIGMETDLSRTTLGLRSRRYSMIVEDGVVKALNVEEKRGTTEKSSAAAIIGQL